MKPYLLITILTMAITQLLPSCKDGAQHDHTADATTYTCPMHPQIVQTKAGTCPICGMDLVVFDRSGKDESITLDENQIMLANITTMVYNEEGPSDASSGATGKRLNGRIAMNPGNVEVISARVSGRLETLYFKEAGVRIKKGDRLYKIFSEELAAMQQEYLIAVAQVREFPQDDQFRKIERAARQKLELSGQSDQQIKQIAVSGKTDPYTYYYANVSGTVAEVLAAEGQYVNEGAEILRVEKYNRLWVVADLYPTEAGLVNEGDEVRVLLPGQFSSKKMKIEFISPDFAPESQLQQLRGSIENEGNRLQPGMQAIVLLNSVNTTNSAIPSGAVIRTGKTTHVWVETGKGKFMPKKVETGNEDARTVQIREGLNNGDKLVVTGGYLLYSEYMLKKAGNNESEIF